MASRVTPGERATASRFVAPVIGVEGVPPDPEERIRQAEAEARTRGRIEGLDAGRREAWAEVEAKLRQLSAAIASLVELRSGVMKRAEQDLLDLAVRIAETVVRERVSRDSEMVVRALGAALAELPKGEPFTVRCHPDDAAALESALTGIPGAGGDWRLQMDPSCSPGGCLVESEAGDLDVRIESQLRVIERELLSRS